MIGVGDEVAVFVACLPLITLLIYCSILIRRKYFGSNNPSIAAMQPPSPRQQEFPRESFNYADYTCPICITQIDLPVETNCGHKFCGCCILENWRVWRREHIGPLKCPLCRTSVRMILPLFSNNNGSPAGADPHLRQREVINRVNRYNSKHAHGRNLIQMMRDAPVLLRHLLVELREMGGLSQLFVAKLVVCILITGIYLVCPIDMLPEAFLGFLGLVDDLLVVMLFFVYVSRMYYGIVQDRAVAD
ncbi:E3 ubiquitin-protein ligase RNF170-like [Neocloeon triangulifer]|uniref:E3 ubiquitin-protein ligase RNF170-like n=1 Tax=Neocloeon triangulifer TaxID=2078957 RepID=UPI00286EBA6D|nr:E3 ubiquitin-protein ligase RNF170-like [Neocloeon triangulifer]